MESPAMHTESPAELRSDAELRVDAAPPAEAAPAEESTPLAEPGPTGEAAAEDAAPAESVPAEGPVAGHGRSRLREAVLNVGAALGIVCIIAAIASISLGVKPLVFRSGSMSPTIKTGAFALSRSVPADQIRPGDVVSVINSANTRVTHRVVSLRLDSGTAQLTLRGDDNPVDDAESYSVAKVDRVFFHVNGFGYVVAALSGRIGVFLGGLLVGALLMFAFGPRPRSNRTARRKAVRA